VTSEITAYPSAEKAAQELIVTVSRLRRRFKEMSGESGLSLPQLSVLSRLAKEGSHTVNDLARAEGVRSQSMVTTAASLESLGLIKRCPDPDDGRKFLLSLTEKGSLHYANTRAYREHWLSNILETRCSKDQLKVLVEVLEILDKHESS